MRKLWAFPLILLLGHLLATGAAAHPLGNFTINHFSRLQLAPSGIALRQIIDMAEIPAFQEIGMLDRNGNERADPEELVGYPEGRCGAIAGDLSLRVGGQPVGWQMTGSVVSFPPGAGGLPTLRLVCDYTAAVELGGSETALEFANQSYADRQGWREIVVTAEGLGLSGEVPLAGTSAELTSYPEDLLSTPLDQRSVSFQVGPAGAAAPAAVAAQPALAGVPGARGDTFTELILAEEWTPITLLAALGVAFVWGAAHALSPGHGKTVVAAYLVGSRGTVRHALFLGLTTTITHTAGVFALGLITLFAAQWIVPERIFPWLSLISGLLVVLIGAQMLWGRLRVFLRHGEKGHHHGHDHDHDPHHHHHHHHGHHDHDHHHDHNHDHDHDHEAGASAFSLQPSAFSPQPSAFSPQPSAFSLQPSAFTHSHLPPGAEGGRVTWRSLLALGVSGGLLPCPSALVVLLSAIALGQVGVGLALVLAFSLGLAGLLTAIGVAFVYAGRLFERVPTRGMLFRLLPALSAAVIVLAGLGISAQALASVL